MIPAVRIPHRAARPRTRATLVAALLLAAAGGMGASALAAEPNSLGNTPAGRQVWRISDYGNVQLVAREPGAPENQHPARLQPDLLKAHLEGATVLVDGAPRPLFASDEIDADIGPLVEAFGRARPDQDVLLVSVARHEGNFLVAPTAITARLFVTGGRLNMVVHDARTDFYDKVRGTNLAPTWQMGSRTTPGKPVLARAGASSPRPDWLVFDLASPPVAATPAVAAETGSSSKTAPLPAPAYVQPPAPPVAPTAAAAPVAPAPVAPAPPKAPVAPAMAAPAAPAVAPVPPRAPAPPATAAPTHPAVPAGADAEQRLETLKRLRDKGLITSEEYERKRKEIIDAL